MSSFNDIPNNIDAGSSGDFYNNDFDFGQDAIQLNDPTIPDNIYSSDLFDPVPLDLSLNVDSTLLPFSDTATPGYIDFSKFGSYDSLATVTGNFYAPVADDDNHFHFPDPEQSPVVEQYDSASEVTASPAVTASPTIIYAPVTIEDLPTSEQNLAAMPVVAPKYRAYQGLFQSGQAAKAHRKKNRRDRKKDPNVAYVRKHGRQYWVERIYSSMINIDHLEDSASSTHRDRFVKKDAFEPDDLEATAHHVFDKALAVHEKGWTRYIIYHKNAVRGALVDKSKNNVELRLQRICQLLRGNKSLVNDALQGGLTLAQLCDNPYLRSGTKAQNNKGNAVRSKRLQAGRELLKKEAAGQPETLSGASVGDE